MRHRKSGAATGCARPSIGRLVLAALATTSVLLFLGCGTTARSSRPNIVVRETPVEGEDTSDVFAVNNAPPAAPAGDPAPDRAPEAAPAATAAPTAPEVAMADRPAAEPAPAPQPSRSAEPREDATERPIQPVDAGKPRENRPAPRREPPSRPTPARSEPEAKVAEARKPAEPSAKPSEAPAVPAKEPERTVESPKTEERTERTGMPAAEKTVEPPAEPAQPAGASSGERPVVRGNEPAAQPAPVPAAKPSESATVQPGETERDRVKEPMPRTPPAIDTTPRTGQPVGRPAPAKPRPVRAAAPFDSPPIDFEFVSMQLEADFTAEDFSAQRMRAVVTYDLRARNGGARTLELDCVGPKVEGVEIGPDWNALSFATDIDSLDIDLPARTTAGQRVQLRISYRVEKAKLGLFFAGEDDDFVVYTHAEPIQARYWLPCHDWPSTRWGSCDVIITTPPEFSAVSVGAPVGEPAVSEGRARHHWRLATPIDPHLFGFAVGRFTTLKFDGGPTPVFAYVQKPYEEAAREAFKDAPAILDYYQKLIGIEYPFPQFSHVSVPGHFHGGMEHAGFDMIAPTMYDAMGSSDRAQFDYVAHMIAHAWFAGIASYAHVTEAWLNEGFATYLHQNWMREKKGEAAFAREMRRARGMIIGFGSMGASQPMVNRAITRPGEIYEFGAGLVYYKGSWVLHMLRHELGEETFWNGVRRYLEQNRWRGAVTADLQAAFEEASGRDLGDFFEQWVHLRGIPKVAVGWRWDEKLGAAVVTVKQTQQIDDRQPKFTFPLDLEFALGEEKRAETVRVGEVEQVFEIALPRKPDRLVADPKMVLLAQMTVEGQADEGAAEE
ncbi:MAG: hypothetical protein AMXMBFR47_15470 [Planctomycetota bacterium]